MIATTIVSDAEVAKIKQLSESHFCDLKSIDIRPGRITRTLAAFANAEGGEVFIGIEDESRQWKGFSNAEEANGHLQAFDMLFPLGVEYQYEFISHPKEDGLVLKATISKSRSIKKASDERVYIRLGAQNQPVVDEGRLAALSRAKGITSFETEVTTCSADVVTNSEPVISFLLEVVPTAEPAQWLKKQQLILEDKPTVAAVVLFADEPQAVLPKRCGVKLYRYKSSEREGTRETLEFDPVSIEGCAYNQIRDSVAKTSEIIQNVQIRTEDGMTHASYPTDAIHEIITNAVIHRDYSVTDDIHIRVFDNRVEVLSPGVLPGHVTVDNILNERYARNPVIVRLINKFPNPPNKDVGEGLNTAFQSMREVKLKEPVISQDNGYVMVTLRHEPLATPEESILLYLSTNAEIANRHAREVCYIQSENKMKRILQSMVASGLLESVPGRNRYTAAYQLTAEGKKKAKQLVKQQGKS